MATSWRASRRGLFSSSDFGGDSISRFDKGHSKWDSATRGRGVSRASDRASEAPPDMSSRETEALSNTISSSLDSGGLCW